jgi:hypothetical protein
MTVNITPLHDRVLVRRLEEKETAKGGIIIPDTAKEKVLDVTSRTICAPLALCRQGNTEASPKMTSISKKGNITTTHRIQEHELLRRLDGHDRGLVHDDSFVSGEYERVCSSQINR